MSALPLSFPAILRQGAAGKDPYAILAETYSGTDNSNNHNIHSVLLRRKAARRHDNAGKRWIRRRENARFAHIFPPPIISTSDQISNHVIPHKPVVHLLPPCRVGPARTPSVDTVSAEFGRFGLSLKGARKTLRRAGGKSRGVVIAVERELVSWINHVGGPIPTVNGQERVICEGISEVTRHGDHALVWDVGGESRDAAFTRYIVHCVARYHNIVSFSRPNTNDDRRLTHLLRPNVARSNSSVAPALDTPLTSDIGSEYSYTSADEFSEFSVDGLSEVEEDDLAGIDELSEGGSDVGDRTFTDETPDRSRSRVPRASAPPALRAASSPSASPARMTMALRLRGLQTLSDSRPSFFDYLYT